MFLQIFSNLNDSVNSWLCQGSMPVREDLQPWDFCQQVLEPMGRGWLDPSSTSRQVWLANSTPGAIALDMAVCVQLETTVWH